ncbi:MAG: hypothetical protein HY841_01455 [Bacteroidetes bacterium]|nr:hypothetical protein [Bacteroidota bacterium]
MNASAKIFFVKLKWFLYEKFSSVFDFILYALNVPVTGTGKLKRSEKKVIVYLGEQLPARIPRIAKWVKRSGEYSTILVCSQRGYFEKFSNNEFDAVFLFRNAFHLKRILKQLPQVSLMHAFAPKSYYPNIARQTLKVPFVLDMQDVYSIYYGLNPALGWLKKELPHERECLEKADGLVAHSLEPNVAFRKYGIKKKPKTIFFPLYCDDDVFQKSPSLPSRREGVSSLSPWGRDGEGSLVYAGGVAGSHRNPKQYGNIQFHEIINILSKQEIHFHIYPSPSNIRADYEEYEQIAKQNSFFHFHEPVAQDKLAEELSKYHFGFHTGFVNKELHKQSYDKYKYCTTLKLFNFIEAGIPVIISENIVYQSWIVKRYKSGILIDKQDLLDLRKILFQDDYTILAENVILAQKKLSLKDNTKRLLNFYNKLVL